MDKNINDVRLSDLIEDSYIMRIPQSVLDEGYLHCQGLIDSVTHAFPNKEIVWVPADLEIIKGDKESIDFLLDQLQKLRDDLNE